jgi:heme A synthase
LLLGLLAAQFCIGLANVAFSLPLWLAALHNAGAALLLSLMVVINYVVFRGLTLSSSSSISSTGPRIPPSPTISRVEALTVSQQILSADPSRSFLSRLRVRTASFYALTKPRVVSLIVFTAVIGMFLATPGMVPPQILLAGTLGIALVAGAAAAFNCLVEQKIDALMQRKRRPLPSGELTPADPGVRRRGWRSGAVDLYAWVNP